MTELKIPAEELSTVLSKAILDSLSVATKERLIESALKYLMTEPKRGSYGETSPSPLQGAFNLALNEIARGVAAEVLESSGARERLAQSFGELIANIPDVETDWTLQQLIMEAVIKRSRQIKDGNY